MFQIEIENNYWIDWVHQAVRMTDVKFHMCFSRSSVTVNEFDVVQLQHEKYLIVFHDGEATA